MLREIIENNLLSYDDWKTAKDDLNTVVDIIGAKLDSNPTGEMGLTPDKIRKSKKYKQLDQDFKDIFKKLQDFNKKSPKEFKRREAKERRANRGR